MKLCTRVIVAFTVLAVAISLAGLAEANPFCFTRLVFRANETFETEAAYTFSCFQSKNYIKDTESAPKPLQVVTYSNSDIPILKNESFSKISENLTTIGLDNVGLKDIESDAFKGLPQLKTLIITNNKLEIIKGEWFRDTKALAMVFLTNNNIHTIEGTFFSNVRSLGVLLVNGNNLTCLPNTELDQLPGVEILGIRNNPWTTECSTWLANKKEQLDSAFSEEEIESLLHSNRYNISEPGLVTDIILPSTVAEEQTGPVNDAYTNVDIQSINDLCNFLKDHYSILYEC